MISPEKVERSLTKTARIRAYVIENHGEKGNSRRDLQNASPQKSSFGVQIDERPHDDGNSIFFGALAKASFEAAGCHIKDHGTRLLSFVCPTVAGVGEPLKIADVVSVKLSADR
ncbi:MAG: hypothetical protein H0U74_11245 [Bradymonadaceae bacterium]|nr:hypothetical protein [Lujinxingiaceae bacterium]